MTKQYLKELALRYKLALAQKDVPVSAIYLFGSYARGNAREGSDIDLCVISDLFGRDDFQEMVLINQVAKRIAPEIEAFPVSEEEFKKKNNPFAVEALKNGQRLA